MLAAAEDLLHSCESLNLILFDRGLEWVISSNMSGSYYEVSCSDAKRYGIETVADMYDYSTLRVTGVERKTVYVTVTATVTDSESGETQTVDIEFGMIEEAEGWRIDSPTYANYNAYLDEYDRLLGELENK